MEEIEKFLQQFKHCRRVRLKSSVWWELKRKAAAAYRQDIESSAYNISTMNSIRDRYKFLVADKFEYVHLNGRTIFYKEGSR